MHELLYCSYADPSISKNDILDILEVSRKNNETFGVTGILLHWKSTNEFVQVLEGDKQVIFDLYGKILKDPRHSMLKLVYDGKIDERGFKDWNMAFQNFEEIDKSKIEGFSNFFTLGFTNERTEISPSTAISLIDTFKKNIP